MERCEVVTSRIFNPSSTEQILWIDSILRYQLKLFEIISKIRPLEHNIQANKNFQSIIWYWVIPNYTIL